MFVMIGQGLYFLGFYTVFYLLTNTAVGPCTFRDSKIILIMELIINYLPQGLLVVLVLLVFYIIFRYILQLFRFLLILLRFLLLIHSFVNQLQFLLIFLFLFLKLKYLDLGIQFLESLALLKREILQFIFNFIRQFIIQELLMDFLLKMVHLL
jgi:hypothetical protein